MPAYVAADDVAVDKQRWVDVYWGQALRWVNELEFYAVLPVVYGGQAAAEDDGWAAWVQVQVEERQSLVGNDLVLVAVDQDGVLAAWRVLVVAQ